MNLFGSAWKNTKKLNAIIVAFRLAKFYLHDSKHTNYQHLIETSLLAGGLEQLPDEAQMEAVIDIMVNEALKSSEIEAQ